MRQRILFLFPFGWSGTRTLANKTGKIQGVIKTGTKGGFGDGHTLVSHKHLCVVQTQLR